MDRWAPTLRMGRRMTLMHIISPICYHAQIGRFTSKGLWIGLPKIWDALGPRHLRRGRPAPWDWGKPRHLTNTTLPDLGYRDEFDRCWSNGSTKQLKVSLFLGEVTPSICNGAWTQKTRMMAHRSSFFSPSAVT